MFDVENDLCFERELNMRKGCIMKKIAFLGLALVLAGCSQLSQFTGGSGSGTANGSVRAKMQSCMFNEASAKFQAGTLFSNSLSATADELVSTCAKKLALQSLGISEENKTAAESIIANFQNMSASK